MILLEYPPESETSPTAHRNSGERHVRWTGGGKTAVRADSQAREPGLRIMVVFNGACIAIDKFAYAITQ